MPSFARVSKISKILLADTDSALQCGGNLQLQTENCTISAEESGGRIETVIETVLNILSIFVGIAAVIMIIIAGFRYITSNGDSGAITSSRNTIIYAIVGIIVVALSQTIVRFVINRVTITEEG